MDTIEITEYGSNYVDVDFIDGEVLVNLRFYKEDVHDLLSIVGALRRMQQ